MQEHITIQNSCIYLRMLSVKPEHNYHHKKLDGRKKRLNEQVSPQHIILVRAVVYLSLLTDL